VSPLRGEKPQNRPLSKRNTGRFALRAMLPVKIADDNITCDSIDAGAQTDTGRRAVSLLH